MKLLVLGGTVFLGRHMVEAAIAAGHEVTLFTRGQSNPDLFPDVEKLRGNRDGQLEALRGRQWDAVIDTSGFVPRVVRMSATLLAPQTDLYIFISSISAYADPTLVNQAEEAPLARLTEEAADSEDVQTYYGELKALCEVEVQQALPGRACIIRPGLIVGPDDKTDRFTYWPARVARGGEVLAPGRRDRPVQLIDVRDLAAWTLRMAEQKRTGVFNATGPGELLTMEGVLQGCRSAIGSDATFTWIPDAFLAERDAQPWMEVPLWIPDDGPSGLMQVKIDKALRTGLTFRPLATTVLDTLAWDRQRPADVQRRAGLAIEKEQQLLAAWHAASINP